MSARHIALINKQRNTLGTPPDGSRSDRNSPRVSCSGRSDRGAGHVLLAAFPRAMTTTAQSSDQLLFETHGLSKTYNHGRIHALSVPRPSICTVAICAHARTTPLLSNASVSETWIW